LELYSDLQNQLDLTIRNNGSVYLVSDEDEMQLLEEYAAICEAENYAYQMLSAEECLQRWPGLRSDYVKAGLFFPEELTVEAREMIHRLIAFMVEHYGLRYLPSTLIREIEEPADYCRLVTAGGEKIEAFKVIVCCGHNIQMLYPELFRSSDLQLVRLQMLQLAQQGSMKIDGNILTGRTIRRYEGFRQCPSYQQIVGAMPDEFGKQWGIHILFKQSPSGEMILGDSHEYLDVGSGVQFSFDSYPEVDAFMIEEAKAIFDLPNWEVTHRWQGIYSQCKQRDILNERISDRIRVITGIGGKGMTGAAGYSEKVIEEFLEVKTQDYDQARSV
jgi:FAD dependent oxidoreductase TIGR03364